MFKTGGDPQDISDSSGPERVTVRIAEMLQELRIQQLANLRELTILVSLQVLLITDLHHRRRCCQDSVFAGLFDARSRRSRSAEICEGQRLSINFIYLRLRQADSI